MLRQAENARQLARTSRRQCCRINVRYGPCVALHNAWFNDVRAQWRGSGFRGSWTLPVVGRVAKLPFVCLQYIGVALRKPMQVKFIHSQTRSVVFGSYHLEKAARASEASKVAAQRGCTCSRAFPEQRTDN